MEAGRAGLPWAGWCRLSSSRRRRRETSSCSSRMAWLGWRWDRNKERHVQCPELRPPPEGLPDAPGLSLSCGPQVQLCRELILELPRVSFFLATYLHTYEFTSLYIWWVKQHILRGSPNPPPLCCAGSLVALLKHQRHIVKIEGRMQNEEGIAEGPL